MSCDNNKNRKAQNKDAVNKAKASLDEATAALAEATKQEKDTEKKRADVVLFEFPGANGHVARCRIPTAAVIHYGVFLILLGSGSTTITNVKAKYADADFDDCTSLPTKRLFTLARSP